jgi:GGDEF domain-containing protein
MSEFLQEISDRLRSARQSLTEARLDGDDFLVNIRLGELESLERLANEHAVGLALP